MPLFPPTISHTAADLLKIASPTPRIKALNIPNAVRTKYTLFQTQDSELLVVTLLSTTVFALHPLSESSAFSGCAFTLLVLVDPPRYLFHSLHICLPEGLNLPEERPLGLEWGLIFCSPVPVTYSVLCKC